MCEKEEGTLWQGLANQPHLGREEEKTPAKQSGLKSTRLIFVLHSSKDLNGKHET